ncbi:hypothetical protein PFICI_14062 [Pestalotiopsis fici W106-1]|uniref:LysM domain-containing protein n=1 Tax=Pestalotiopsis fici (strain W106-1 / CGMCC3.15140) TaxID=1229662 RepID=W3WN03_PESFW|nr:uncharacterized protein PFICI_14062 [Pestalotiopsis fici W106-1]ETS74196.1 hypothetical protein PFICI_14062 [Pestalotiopsis fici W106-1]
MAAFTKTVLLASVLAASASLVAADSSCDTSALNTTTGTYYIAQENTTIFDVAAATNRGVCDIGRVNCMADVTIVPNVGQNIVIPPEVCEPDNDSCLLPTTPSNNTCVNGGPRLYYTVNGDTYERIAQRLNITVDSLLNGNASATEVLPVGQFVKVPLCEPSQCILQPYQFTYGVYKDLAEKYGSTVGQIMMLSPTYNYSEYTLNGNVAPTIDLPINCTALSKNVTVIS